MHAWLLYRNRLCPDCGTSEEDWLDLGTRKLRNDPAWEAVTHQCQGCAELSTVLEEVPDRIKGVRAYLVPRREEYDDE